MDSAARLSREHAAAAAAEWSLRFREGRPSKAERIEFVRWLRDSPRNVAEYLRVANTSAALSEFRGWSELPQPPADEMYPVGNKDENVRWLAATHGEPPRPGSELASSRSIRRTRSLVAVGALAATLAVAAFGALWWLGVIGGAVYATGPGESRNVRLADGSEVSLASQTRLRVDFDSDLREIVLNRGEALFHVTKDAVRPFVVRAGRTTARAIGTAFSVQRDARQVVVTVGEGRVAIGRLDAVRLPFGALPAHAVVSLTADQQVSASSGGELDGVRAVDSQRILAWAQGHLIFENETIDAVVARFNQFARIKLRVEDPRIGARTVSGIFEAHDPESFVAFLASVEQVSIVHTGSGEIVIESPGSAEPDDIPDR